MAVGSWPRQGYLFLELTTTALTVTFARSTHTYTCTYALLCSFFSSNPSSLFVWLHQLLIPPTPRADATTHPQSYSDPSSSTLRTVHTHQTSNKATAKTVFSLYGDDRNTGTRQTPKVSSAIAEIYHCLTHNRRQIMVQAQGGGGVYTRTGGLYTLHTCTIVVRLYTAP